ncbi:hypothetical protein GCM10023065_24690 [Microbacterium laevaniformans]|uniref:hypothetical protein n=1 Tax=Microbacterium laevaniformans TaxID=36807 RepID=UPI00195B2832|nr:hypothetical protein [Microbacterium laevaniformans]MBM7753427.1 hypothetical protein [Microbacterium laevaniformans]GLJ65544.1 hypothetical protein GCM10017578_24330 [Microbacterium laevaniformans]
MDAHQRRNLALAVAGTVLVVAYAAWAAVHVLIVNPLAAMPGYTVGEIHDAMTAAGQWSGPLRVYITLAIGPLLAIAALIVTVRRRDLSITSVASVYLALIVLGAPGYFWAAFDIGMGMADTFQINGGDYSPWAGPLYALSFAALVALIAVGALVLLRRRTPAAGR